MAKRLRLMAVSQDIVAAELTIVLAIRKSNRAEEHGQAMSKRLAVRLRLRLCRRAEQTQAERRQYQHQRPP